MGSVYLASLDSGAHFRKLLALKRIHEHLEDEPGFVQMFLDEARITSQIGHSNVCQVFDYGQADGHPFIAMELLLGETLRAIIKHVRSSGELVDEPRHAAKAAFIVAQACAGLHAAHELKDGEQALEVVHRDVSPQNILVTYEGQVKVMDFGIAHASGRLHQTDPGTMKGKFPYMAPEVFSGGTIDRRADIWSLGVTLWELVARRSLFARGTHVETIKAVSHDPVPKLSELRPGLSPELDAVVMRALGRDPQTRYATAQEFATALMRYCHRQEFVTSPVEISQWIRGEFATRCAKRTRMLNDVRNMPAQSGAADVDVYSGASNFPSYGSEVRAKRPVERSEPSRRPWLVALLMATALLVAGSAVFAALNWSPQVDSQIGDAPSETAGQEPAPSVESMPVQDLGEEVADEDHIAEEVSPPATNLARSASFSPTTHRSTGAVSRRVRRIRSQRRAVRVAMPAETSDAENTPVSGPETTPESSEHSEANVDEQTQDTMETATSGVSLPSSRTAQSSEIPSTRRAGDSRATPSNQATQRNAQKTGPKPSLAAQVSLATLVVRGSLPSGVIRRALAKVKGRYASCYREAARKARRDGKGTTRVTFRISTSGSTRGVSASGNPLPGIAACVGSATKKVRSSQRPDTGTVEVSFQVDFRPL